MPDIAPHDTLAERAVLASMMLSPEQARYCHGHLTESDFHHASHRLTFKAAVSLVTDGEPVNLITLVDRMRCLGTLEDAGGIAGVCGLHEWSVPAAACPAYAKILREKRVRRGLQNYGHDLQADAVDGESAGEVVAAAQARLADLADASTATRPLLTAMDAILDVAHAVEEAEKAPTSTIGIPSGFFGLDRLTAGFHPGELIVLAARPRMGKTAIAMNAGVHVTDRGIPALIFSAEMTARQLWMRAICGRIGCDFQALMRGKIDPKAFAEACGYFSRLPLFTDETPGIKFRDLEAKARSWAAEKPRGLIITDYLQLVQADGRHSSREGEVGSVSRGLKRLARQVNMPVLALAQLNRDLERRDNKRPILSDLRDSGQIEQDADVVLFLYRDAVYGGTDAGSAELIVAKQRNGPCETVPLRWNAERTTFTDDNDQPVYNPRNYQEGHDDDSDSD